MFCLEDMLELSFLLFSSPKSRCVVYRIIFRETVKDRRTEREAELRIRDIVFCITKQYMHQVENTDNQRNEKIYNCH